MIDYYMIIIMIIVVVGLVAAAIKFFRLTKDQQIRNIKEWLLIACLEAEQLLGSKTGRIKLRYVYDLFVTKFRFMAYIISFEQFSLLVDEALDVMRDLIETNQAVKAIVESDK